MPHETGETRPSLTRQVERMGALVSVSSSQRASWLFVIEDSHLAFVILITPDLF
jgi:hypothetical protein